LDEAFSPSPSKVLIAMKNTKLVEEAKLHPTRIYSRPQDVLRDRRLNDIDRLEILTAWERDVRSAENSSSDGASEPPGRLQDVVQARQEVEGRVPSTHVAGESRLI
jgi:hypothetical protein